MISLETIVDRLNLEVLTEQKELQHLNVSSGYTSDLLSCVMAGAKSDGIWVTIQSHMNIVAVAAVLELSAVVITEGSKPDPETIEKANQQGVILLSSPDPSFTVVGNLWELGIRAG